jgi:hypothetical protein
MIRQANDGSGKEPRLEIQQAMWSMSGYGDNRREWSLEEKFERIAAAGFTGIFSRLPDAGEESIWRKLMEEYKFSFGLESFPTAPGELRELLERASDFDVLYVNAQVPDSFTVGRQAIDRLQALMEEAARFDQPFFIETHRGKVTQDLLRTAEYVETLPDMRLTIDFSHYVLAGEMYDFEQAEPYFDQLLARTSSIHGRITNAQQIQIDIGPSGEHPMTDPFIRWWRKGMSYWLEQAGPGDVLPFVCEIGHHYMVTPDYTPSYSWEEHFDRWEQSQVFKRLAERAWKAAESAR